MTCRLLHRWSGWAFEVFEDPWNGGYQISRDRVWRMCRRCGHEQHRDLRSEATASVEPGRLARWKARMP